ncbi:MAG: hypothetical protein MK108_12335 [Mariniblastus sp.]|nr:hypothetical protein [Mariniblastus sp.]
MAGKKRVKVKQKAGRDASRPALAGARLVKWFGAAEESPLNWGRSVGSEFGPLAEKRRAGPYSTAEKSADWCERIEIGLQRADIPAAYQLLERVWQASSPDGSDLPDWGDWRVRLLSSKADQEPAEESSPEQVLFFQLAAIELPLTWAAAFPWSQADREVRLAIERMSELVQLVLDGDGMPGSGVIPVFAPLLASWARSYRLFRKLGFEIDSEGAEVLESLVQQVLRFLSPEGSLMLAGPEISTMGDDFWKFILKMSSDPIDKHLAKYCFPPVGRDKLSRRELPQTSSCSEWGELAVLQSYWKAGLPKLAVDFSCGQNRVELASQVTLLAGDLTPQISLNGQVALNRGDCVAVCWHQDEEVDYLEIEFDMSAGIAVQRQYILVREDQILVVLDSVKSETAGRIDYECTVPLAPGITALGESETAEVYLRSGREIESLVVPLGLSEWKVDRHEGTLGVHPDELKLHQSIDGSGLCASLLFDLNRRRSVRPRTWRRLHVMEKLELVNRDRAVAYRVQLDQQQWVIYRSIAENGNRTFLGENFSNDFFMGRFFRNGTVEDLIQVEQ